MNRHTTHFDDCGCKSKEYETRISTLEKSLDRALEHSNARKNIIEDTAKTTDFLETRIRELEAEKALWLRITEDDSARIAERANAILKR